MTPAELRRIEIPYDPCLDCGNNLTLNLKVIGGADPPEGFCSRFCQDRYRERAAQYVTLLLAMLPLRTGE